MEKDSGDILADIKKLLILALVKQGVQSKEIASTLGVDPAIISRTVPSRLIRKKGSK